MGGGFALGVFKKWRLAHCSRLKHGNYSVERQHQASVKAILYYIKHFIHLFHCWGLKRSETCFQIRESLSKNPYFLKTWPHIHQRMDLFLMSGLFFWYFSQTNIPVDRVKLLRELSVSSFIPTMLRLSVMEPVGTATTISDSLYQAENQMYKKENWNSLLYRQRGTATLPGPTLASHQSCRLRRVAGHLEVTLLSGACHPAPVTSHTSSESPWWLRTSCCMSYGLFNSLFMQHEAIPGVSRRTVQAWITSVCVCLGLSDVGCF